MSKIPYKHDDMGRLVGMTGRFMERLVNQRLKEAGHEMDLMHCIVLKHLWMEDGRIQQALGDFAGRDKTRMTRAIDLLEKQNIVVRVPDQQDRRHKRIFLTHKGRALENELEPLMIQAMEDTMAHIPLEEIQICKSVLQRMMNNLSEIHSS
ncbi:MAG: MarR family transcriptional regulator [Bacteroidota bacterium]